MNNSSSWYVKKPYLHFDLPWGEARAKKYVTNAKKVIRHPFYPFLRYDLVTPRVGIQPQGSSPIAPNDKHRQISYPAHKDGYIFSYYKSQLEPKYETWLAANELTEAVTAFRSTGKNNIALAKEAFKFVAQSGDCDIYVTDVASFFDTIDHVVLKDKWARQLEEQELPEDHYAVFKALTRYSYVERHKVYNLFRIPLNTIPNKKLVKRICTPEQFRSKVLGRTPNLIHPGAINGIGIPQGSSLSPLLSNIYMADLDLAMNELASSLGGKYWRYCDDILIVVPQGKLSTIEPEMDRQLKTLILKRHPDKTHKLKSQNLSTRPLQYLGLVFDGSHIAVRPSSIQRNHRKLKKAIQATRFRRERETEKSGKKAPLRRQALYNMYSELPTRGKKILKINSRKKYTGNFINYLRQAEESFGSKRIQKQRTRLQRRFWNVVRKHI